MHIVSITNEGISIIGPFGSEEAATEWGNAHIEDPRWNVADVGHPVEWGMALDENFDVPHFVVPVTAP